MVYYSVYPKYDRDLYFRNWSGAANSDLTVMQNNSLYYKKNV